MQPRDLHKMLWGPLLAQTWHLPPPPGSLGSPGVISQYPDYSPHSRASAGKIWWELQLTRVKSCADGGDFSKDRPVQLVCSIWRKTWAAQSTSYWTHPAIEPLKCTYFKSPSWDGLYVYNTHYILKIVAEKKKVEYLLNYFYIDLLLKYFGYLGLSRNSPNIRFKCFFFFFLMQKPKHFHLWIELVTHIYF